MDSGATSKTRQWSQWWILFWYFYLSALQSLLWMTFSSVPDSSRDYLSVDDSTLDLWLDLGPIAFCITVWGAMYLLTERADGLRFSVLLAAALLCGASLLRSIPALLPAAQRSSTGSLACIYVGQFINAGVAPLIVASPAYLSLLWFDESRRNVVTAIANTASAAGRAVGFFLGPALVSTAADIPTLLAVECALAVLPLIAVLLYFPVRPLDPPSRAAAAEFERLDVLIQRRGSAGAASDEGPGVSLLLKQGGEGEEDSDAIVRRSACASVRDSAYDVWAVVCSPSFALVALSGGAQMAVFGAWSGTLPTVLSPRFTDAQAGVFGSVCTFAGIAGGLAFGYASDTPALRTSLRGLLICLCLASGALFTLIALALKPIALDALSPTLDFWPLLVLCGFAGLLRGGADPLFFEAAAETAHPHAAGTAGGILTFFYHIVLVGCLSLSPGVMQWSMTAMGVTLGTSALLLVPVRIRYNRR